MTTRRYDVHPPLGAIRPVVRAALAEDLLPLGDLSASLLDPGTVGGARLVARAGGVIAGTASAAEVFAAVDPQLVYDFALDDGDTVTAGEVIGRVYGPFASLLTAERTALNFLSHLSGIATLTRRYVEAVAATNPTTRVWDTRKTTPGLRALEKAAVRAGGGANHRGSLSEALLIKDNHLGVLSIEEAVRRGAERWPGRMLEVECDTLDQVRAAVGAGASLVLCDNMSPDEVAAAVAIVAEARAGAPGSCLVEASGGITLESIAAYAAAGADVISVGALTHSAPILDIALDVEG